MKLIAFILLFCVFNAYASKMPDNKKEISLNKSQNGKEEIYSKNRKHFINPLKGEYRISSKFGNRKHPIHGRMILHKGVDYAAKLGTPIHAVADGVIEYIGNNGGYGKYIRIRHENNYSTCYAHMSRFNANIKLGSRVKQGEVIAYVGSTGAATGPHLHYEIIHNGKHIDPLTVEHIKLK